MKGDRIGEFEEIVMLAARRLGAAASSLGIQEVLASEAARKVSLGAIYAAMDRLERKGFVTSELAAEPSEKGGRRRRCYQLTEAGGEALERVRRLRNLLWESAADNTAGRT